MIQKRTLIRILVSFVTLSLLVGAVLAIFYFLSWKNVAFTLSSNTKSVAIYYSNADEDYNSEAYRAASVNSSSTIRLRTGSYVAIPSGDNIANTSVKFEVKDDTSVDINPYYTDTYLVTSLNGEIPTINSVLATQYPILSDVYTVEDGHFYHFGDWYATTLYNSSPAPGDGVDIYGVVLHKVDGKWLVAAKPSIVFTYKDNPSIPSDIIDAANSLTDSL